VGPWTWGECPEFDNLWTEGARPAVSQADYRQAESEVVRAGTPFFNNHPNMGAMVLACTGFPPFTGALKREIGIALLSWGRRMDFTYSITVHRDYYGHVQPDLKKAASTPWKQGQVRWEGFCRIVQ
jgi:hypothetical protein